MMVNPIRDPESSDPRAPTETKQGLQHVISVDPLVWHMDQWEIHALRGLVAAMLLEANLYAHSAQTTDATALTEKLISLKDDQFDRQLRELRNEVERDIGRHPRRLMP